MQDGVVNGKPVELYDFHARFYDPFIARWMKQDRLAKKYAPVSPYNYCANNPIGYIDPTGDSLWFSYDFDRFGALTGITLNFQGSLLNNSSWGVSMYGAANRIASQIESSFTGKINGINFNVRVDISVAKSMNEVKSSDHLFVLTDGIDYRGKDVPGASNMIGGKVAFLDVSTFIGPWDAMIGNVGPVVGAHEAGHLFGLGHSSERRNLMNQGIDEWLTTKTRVNDDQRESIYRAYERGGLNQGSNFELIRTPSPSSPTGTTMEKRPNEGQLRGMIK